jgi:AhpD family alkylhydroperoxidase
MDETRYCGRRALEKEKEAYLMESQVELNRERLRLRGKFSDTLPEFMGAESAMLDLAYRDGELSAKMKRLIALGIALRARCANCVLSQTQGALDAGATKGEILETLQVVVAMSGTTGIAESLRVIRFLEELGM